MLIVDRTVYLSCLEYMYVIIVNASVPTWQLKPISRSQDCYCWYCLCVPIVIWSTGMSACLPFPTVPQLLDSAVLVSWPMISTCTSNFVLSCYITWSSIWLFVQPMRGSGQYSNQFHSLWLWPRDCCLDAFSCCQLCSLVLFSVFDLCSSVTAQVRSFVANVLNRNNLGYVKLPILPLHCISPGEASEVHLPFNFQPQPSQSKFPMPAALILSPVYSHSRLCAHGVGSVSLHLKHPMLVFHPPVGALIWEVFTLLSKRFLGPSVVYPHHFVHVLQVLFPLIVLVS